MTNDSPAPLIDTTVSHSARVWNYWLGGKDHYPVDREVGDRVAEMYPDIVLLARAARAFLSRAVQYLAGEAGIRQFLDVGTGLPTVNNTHEIAQSIAPESRVVYADNDPLVLAHARALLTSSPEGVTDYIDADLRDPGKILQEAARTLDFSKPVAITLIAILHHIPDFDEARSIVTRLMEAVPSGSYLVISHSTNVIYGADLGRGCGALEQVRQTARHPPQPRADRSVLRWPGSAGARRRVDPPVASQCRGHRGRRAQGGGSVLRRRAQAVVPVGPKALPRNAIRASLLTLAVGHDRNTNSGAENLCTDVTIVVADQRVYHEPGMAPCVVLPVVRGHADS